ncbi:MAG: DUF1146 family protein [Bacilli bacterium]|jgi:uncharacterized integral membrane protein (TIGR02327 family)|nr:DUF1146 family protein [Bacilli bacterium]
MNGKLILYLVITPLVIWSLDSLNINVLFKKNKYMEARVIYILIGIAISYLAVNFLYDFFELSSYY